MYFLGEIPCVCSLFARKIMCIFMKSCWIFININRDNQVFIILLFLLEKCNCHSLFQDRQIYFSTGGRYLIHKMALFHYYNNNKSCYYYAIIPLHRPRLLASWLIFYQYCSYYWFLRFIYVMKYNNLPHLSRKVSEWFEANKQPPRGHQPKPHRHFVYEGLTCNHRCANQGGAW